MFKLFGKHNPGHAKEQNAKEVKLPPAMRFWGFIHLTDKHWSGP